MAVPVAIAVLGPVSLCFTAFAKAHPRHRAFSTFSSVFQAAFYHSHRVRFSF